MERHEKSRHGQVGQHCGDLVLPRWVMAQHAPNLHSFPQNEVIDEYVK